MALTCPARTATALAALVLSLAACTGTEQEPAPSSDGGGAETSDSAPEASEAPSAEGGAQPGHETGTLTITHDGEETAFTPEVVRCEGEPGTIRHLTLKMEGDELPLVEVTPGEFAMVKLEREGAPEKSTSTAGITAEDGAVEFDAAEIGDVVVHGTVNCPEGAQD
ncbi:hypothetical protein [Brachybacterium sp. sponge]|uniref:hypothetical protein n=1 Tax=Brachybacterium sp. sponge TaxID=1775432 RepID=UPI0007A38AC3|nr:hypothetical protein [Brachybacterium sp. sponge]